MCKPSEAQVWVVYCDADKVLVTVLDIDSEGAVLNHRLVGDIEYFMLNQDGAFEEVEAHDSDDPKQCPWEPTGRLIRPPHKLEERGRYVPATLS